MLFILCAGCCGRCKNPHPCPSPKGRGEFPIRNSGAYAWRDHCVLRAAIILVVVCVVGFSAAAQVAAIPHAIALTRAGQSHRVIVEARSGDLWTGDVTERASFASSDANVATVDAQGHITAVGNGEAVVTATVDGQATTVAVRVSGADQDFQWSFRNHVQPIFFKMGCSTGACHGAAAGKNGFKLSLRSFDNDWDHKAVTRQANGRRVSLAQPDDSLVLLKPTMGVPHEGGLRFEKDSEAYAIVKSWITAGAPPAHPDDPFVERIEVMPESVMVTPSSRRQVVVRAFYSNGTYEDVTRWAKFGTTDESVALVDDEGRITVEGPGAAAITVWYASKVASMRVMAPRELPVDDAIFANAARFNFVDERVLAQLAQLRIPPAPLCTDTEFIRRAYLDCLGILPTPTEVFAFVMNPAAEKRTQLVERILARPEFVDYWTYKWSDLLLLSSRNLTDRKELTAFHQFIRASVEANMPWDDFVRTILTAQGNTIENGAANYFVMHKETVDLTETTSQAFLGMSLTCARCHNHPLEKWTQDDYYGMANLFATVTIKNSVTGQGNDVVAAPFGDVIHPRLGRGVAPKPLDAEAMDVSAGGDRRAVLARWLTAPENPYFTRAVVNRVWTNFMGRGIVHPEDDLRLTNPASNESLMKALSDDLIEHDFDMRHLIRTIMSSATYQRSSNPVNAAVPDEKYYSQYIVRRLNAEVILDVYSQVTAVPTVFDGYPKGFRALQLPDSQVGSYFLSAFGRPPRIQTCSCERTEDSSIAQTLHMANGDTLTSKLRDQASAVTRWAAMESGDVIDEIYLRALSRYPNHEEHAQAREILDGAPTEERRAAVEDLVWAILTGKEFLFNH